MRSIRNKASGTVFRISIGLRRLARRLHIWILCAVTARLQLAARAQSGSGGSEYTAPDPSKIKRELHSILSQPEFADRPQKESSFIKALEEFADRVENAWHDVSRFLDRWYERLKDIFTMRGVSISATSHLFVGVFIAACLLAAVYLFARYVAGRRRIPGEPIASQSLYSVSEPDLAAAQGRTAEEWMLDANQLASQCNYRAAIRARFLAELLQLSAYGLLEYAGARTNGEQIVYLTQQSESKVPLALHRRSRFDSSVLLPRRLDLV